MKRFFYCKKNPAKKIGQKIVLSVEKSNVGNRLKRVFPNSQANRSHPRGVNVRSKFSIFSFFSFRFFDVLSASKRRIDLRLWQQTDLELPDVSKIFYRGRRWWKLEKLIKTSRKFLKKWLQEINPCVKSIKFGHGHRRETLSFPNETTYHFQTGQYVVPKQDIVSFASKTMTSLPNTIFYHS